MAKFILICAIFLSFLAIFETAVNVWLKHYTATGKEKHGFLRKVKEKWFKREASDC
ncbi:hypothetical protein [Peribacillus tepidiphilus]|uniref:hypothetical protein n=1 Tax=Peribacillus tepidiphilus TaxID=2652445 RepID=UPI0012913CB9|nr:hypothetical protein [Peribacillus tepidiphilus]